MAIANELFDYVEGLQRAADRSFALYPENDGILPNDAIAPLRIYNLKKVCELIQQITEQSGRSLSDVLTLSIKPEINAITSAYPYTEQALEKIIEKYSA